MTLAVYYRALCNDLQWADFRYCLMYTNRFRNQENGDCLLQWPVSIAGEDGNGRTEVVMPGFDVIMKLTASGRAVPFDPGLPRRRKQQLRPSGV
jgi:hypothetical protein